MSFSCLSMSLFVDPPQKGAIVRLIICSNWDWNEPCFVVRFGDSIETLLGFDINHCVRKRRLKMAIDEQKAINYPASRHHQRSCNATENRQGGKLVEKRSEPKNFLFPQKSRFFPAKWKEIRTVERETGFEKWLLLLRRLLSLCS